MSLCASRYPKHDLYFINYLYFFIVKECERMNLLVAEMRRTLKELDLGLKGELTITSDMEDLSDSLFFDQVGHRRNVLIFDNQPQGSSFMD